MSAPTRFGWALGPQAGHYPRRGRVSILAHPDWMGALPSGANGGTCCQFQSSPTRIGWALVDPKPEKQKVRKFQSSPTRIGWALFYRPERHKYQQVSILAHPDWMGARVCRSAEAIMCDVSILAHPDWMGAPDDEDAWLFKPIVSILAHPDWMGASSRVWRKVRSCSISFQSSPTRIGWALTPQKEDSFQQVTSYILRTCQAVATNRLPYSRSTDLTI